MGTESAIDLRSMGSGLEQFTWPPHICGWGKATIDSVDSGQARQAPTRAHSMLPSPQPRSPEHTGTDGPRQLFVSQICAQTIDDPFVCVAPRQHDSPSWQLCQLVRYNCAVKRSC